MDVFLCYKMSWATLSLSINPLLLALLLMIFFTDFTLPFDWGYATDDSLWLVMPQLFMNCWKEISTQCSITQWSNNLNGGITKYL